MPPVARAQFSGVIEELPRMLLWIRNQLSRTQIDQREIHKLELASEEAIVNVIHYAYQDKGGEIELTFRETGEGVEIAIRDHGPPFDPLTEAPTPDQVTDLDHTKVGGLGVFLMRASTDDLLYQREGRANVLTLVKRFSQKR